MVNINKKRSYFRILPLLIVAFILFRIINNPKSYDLFTKIINPFVWAFFVSYLLNPILVNLENKLKLKRVWNILIVYIMLFGIITLVITIITPRIVQSVKNIANDFPSYIDATEKWISSQPNTIKYLDKYGVINYIEENINNWMEQLNQSLNSILNKTISQVINITSALFNFILGIVISVYILKDKEYFKMHGKKVIYAFFHKEMAESIIENGRDLNDIFSRFLVGKFIDSLIIGIICFIGCLIIKTPYPLVMGTIIGVTNMIPYFGPFIGAVPVILITLFYSPIKALWVAIFILALQQFDGLYLGPKIMGIKVGLRPFWIISAIIVGGGLFGVMGMLLAVPFAALFKAMIKKFVDKKISDKNIIIK